MSLKKNIIANYVGQGWAALMGLAFVPLYIKYLGIEAYGLIGFYAMLSAWLGLFNMGMQPTLNREMARFTGGTHNAQSIHNLLRTIEIICFSIALLIAIGVWFASEWLTTVWLNVEDLPKSTVTQAISIMGLVTALSFATNIYNSSISGLQKQVLLNVVTSFMSTVRGVGAVGILAWISPTLEAFFLWQFTIYLITFTWLRIVLYRALPRTQHQARFSIYELKKIWRFAAGMIGLTLLSVILTQIDKILLSRLLTLTAFGYYILAANLAHMLTVFTGPILNAVYPRFTQLVAQNALPQLIETYHLTAQLISVLVGSLAVMLIIFSEPLLFIWTGDHLLTAEVAPILSILAFGTLMNRLGAAAPYRLQLAYGQTKLGLGINLIAIMVIIPALFIVVPIYGVLGAAYSWCVLNVGYFLVIANLTHSRLLIGEKWRFYVSDVISPFGAASCTALFIRLVIPLDTGRFTTAIYLIISGFLIISMAILFANLVRFRVFLYGKKLVSSIGLLKN